MKKLIFILLCFSLLTFGSSAKIIEVAPAGAWGVLGISGGGAVAEEPACAFDLCETFDATGYDNTGGAPNWTETQGAPNEDDSSPTQGSSTYSLEITPAGGGGEEYATLTFASAQDNIELTFWIYITNSGGNNNTEQIAIFDSDSTADGTAGEEWLVKFQDDETYIEWGGGQYDNFTTSDWDDADSVEGKWFKIFVNFNRNAASTIYVYDSDGETLINSISPASNPADVAIGYIHFGARESSAYTVNLDTIGIDFQ